MWCILFCFCDQITAWRTKGMPWNVCHCDVVIPRSNVMMCSFLFCGKKTVWRTKRTSQNVHRAWKKQERMPHRRWCGDSPVYCDAIHSLVRSKNSIERVRICLNLHINMGRSAVTSCVTRALKSTPNLKTGFDQIRVFDQYSARLWALQSHICHCKHSRWPLITK